MAQKELEEYSNEALTPLENRKMRRLLETDERAHWLWQSLRVWLTLVASFVTAAIVIANGGVDLLKKLLFWK